MDVMQRRKALGIGIVLVGIGAAAWATPQEVTADASQVAHSHVALRAEDARRELVDKVATLVRARFGGDWERAFSHYAGDDQIDETELREVLADARVGNIASRGFWVDGILERIDRAGDGAISREEFRSALR